MTELLAGYVLKFLRNISQAFWQHFTYFQSFSWARTLSPPVVGDPSTWFLWSISRNATSPSEYFCSIPLFTSIFPLMYLQPSGNGFVSLCPAPWSEGCVQGFLSWPAIIRKALQISRNRTYTFCRQAGKHWTDVHANSSASETEWTGAHWWVGLWEKHTNLMAEGKENNPRNISVPTDL